MSACLSLVWLCLMYYFHFYVAVNVFFLVFCQLFCQFLKCIMTSFLSRLNLSPSPSQHAPISRTHVHATRKGWGKKRKHEGGTGLSPSYKVSQHSSARGCVSIDEIDLDGNFIRLKNNSDLVKSSHSVTRVHERL